MSKAIIVGGGIAGLASGIALSNAGWDVEVLERARLIEPMGAALSLWPNACAAMSSIGILSAVETVAAPIRAMSLNTRKGKQILHRSITEPAMIAARTVLQNALVAALGSDRLRLDCEVISIEGRHIILAGGETLTCDLVVDAGGIRARSVHDAKPRYAGYGGVLALSNKVEGPSLDGVDAEYWGEDERFGVFELPNERRYWFYMQTQPHDAAMPTLAECESAAFGWPSTVKQAVSATSEAALIPFAIHAKPPPKTLCAPGIVRVGDAAHAMEPNLGQGACQALEDAAALQAIVSTCPIDKIGSTYERLRLKRARMFVRESSQARFGAHGPAVLQAMLKMALRAIPGAISEPRIRAMQTMPDYTAKVS